MGVGGMPNMHGPSAGCCSKTSPCGIPGTAGAPGGQDRTKGVLCTPSALRRPSEGQACPTLVRSVPLRLPGPSWGGGGWVRMGGGQRLWWVGRSLGKEEGDRVFHPG